MIALFVVHFVEPMRDRIVGPPRVPVDDDCSMHVVTTTTMQSIQMGDEWKVTGAKEEVRK